MSTFEDDQKTKRPPFEQAALDDLRNELIRRGRKCADLGCPDLDHGDPLTVDGRFNIDGREWAIEHCRIVYEPKTVPAEHYANKVLGGRLEEIAETFEVALSLALFPPRWEKGTPPPVAFYDDVVK